MRCILLSGRWSITQRLTALLLMLVVHALVHAATAAEITGRVVGITDGDTLTVLDQSQRQTRIRLAEIDSQQPTNPTAAAPSRLCQSWRSAWTCGWLSKPSIAVGGPCGGSAHDLAGGGAYPSWEACRVQLVYRL